MISCILLTAGFSQRFGSPKALALLGGKTVIERQLSMLIDSNVDVIYVVTGAYRQNIKPYILNHKKVCVVYNKDYKFGQTASFQCGIARCPDACRGVMLLPVDYPLIQKETINSIIEAYFKYKALIVIPTFGHRKGHPPLFHHSLIDEFKSLTHGNGCHEIPRRHRKEILCWPVADPGVCLSFNTQEELEELKGFLS